MTPNKTKLVITEDKIDIQSILYRYFAYWPYILASAIIFILGAFLYLRYTPSQYNTTAKIKILADKETTDISLNLDKILGKNKVSLENERAVLTSYRLNTKVVKKLNLQVDYYQKGLLNQIKVHNPPFIIKYISEADATKTALEYNVTILENGYKLENIKTGTIINISGKYFNKPTNQFPFTIAPVDLESSEFSANNEFTIKITTNKLATKRLLNKVVVEAGTKDSDILTLNYKAANWLKAKTILNTLIDVYIQDGIIDRQQVSKNTIDFVDKRFEFLALELDTIEVDKGIYKQKNNISYLPADVQSVLQQQIIKDEKLFEVETQLLLVSSLEKTMDYSIDFELLPANIGISSDAINLLIGDYNSTILEYNKWKTGAGENNPTIKILKQELLDIKTNIKNSLKGYRKQLEATFEQNKQSQNLSNKAFSSIPVKEKILRSIDREQLLKENLYLLLLQKREEAAINMAIASSNIKVIDYALTNTNPVSPKKGVIVLAALFIGVFIPIGFVHLKFLLNNKIQTSKDIEDINPNSLVLGEIPKIRNTKTGLVSKTEDPQTSEAFRTLAHSVNFVTTQKLAGKTPVIGVTSSVKGEGKTTVSFNVAQSYYQLKKNVLLVGADLRNPQLHHYLDLPKSTLGFSSYLTTPDLDWQDFLYKMETETEEDTNKFDVLLSGPIPPMPSVLLTNQRFKDFLEEARKKYDYVILDTAPTLLVADTLTFIKQVDFTLYVVRSEITKKELISYSKKLIAQEKIGTMGYVINDVNFNGSYGYGYNYGYGYGYGGEKVKTSWFKRFKKR